MKKRSGLDVSSYWSGDGLCNSPHSLLDGSNLDPGARFHVNKSESPTQDEGRMLGPIWPNCLAIAPAALQAGAAGTMPGVYCCNIGTWGSPYAGKVGPTSGPTKKTYKTWIQARRWVSPSTPQRRLPSSTETIGKGVGGLRVHPFPAAAPDEWPPGTITSRWLGYL